MPRRSVPLRREKGRGGVRDGMPARAALRGSLSHAQLCQMLVDNLTAQGWRVWRLDGPGKRLTSAGIPDLYAMRDCAVWLEAKVGRDSLTPAQAAFFEATVGAGVECYEVRPENVDEVLEALQ